MVPPHNPSTLPMRPRQTAARSRRRRPRRLVLACMSVAGLVALIVPLGSGAPRALELHVAQSASTSPCPWLNQSLPISERVNMLMARMSLADKIAEMYIDRAGRSGPYAGYEGYVPAQPALCIPDLVEQDGPLGVGYGATDVTQLPAEVSLGSAWDPSLAYQYGLVNGQQHREKGIAMALGPGVNIQRDPRWGRNFEMFSEDPFLTSALGTADIEGLQSQDVMADVKHFVTYNQETYRATPYDDTIVSERALHEIYLPPFYSAVEQAHAASIMCAYPLLNGQYSCQDSSLLTGILDDRWGFPGFIRADSDANNSTVDSANAGLDQERGSFYWDNGRLAAAVADGQVQAVDDQPGRPPDPDRDVRVRSVQRSAHGEPVEPCQHLRRRRVRPQRRRAWNRAAPEHRATSCRSAPPPRSRSP